MGLWARRLSFCSLGDGLRGAAWDLCALLFSTTDHRTRVVSHVEPSRRLRDVRLLDEWMVDRLFVASGWARRVRESGETAPRVRRLRHEHRVMRFMLHRFVADESLWRDELQELMRRLTRGHGISSNVLERARGAHTGQEINFYSVGLEDVLRRFVQDGGSGKFFTDPAALWCSFIVSNRNMPLLPSPQRPPFTPYKPRPMLTVMEFEELPASPLPSVSDSREDESCDVHLDEEKSNAFDARETTQDVLVKSDVMDDTSPLMRAEAKMNEDRLELEYDALCMSIVDPVASSMTKDPKVDAEDVEREDLQLSCLWESFRTTSAEDIIDNHRSVCARVEEMQTTVLHEMLVRKALLLFFFARDEVRAVTEPAVSYQRLRHLHCELCVLSQMCTDSPEPVRCVAEDSAPHAFEKLSIASQLSFTCFGQAHAPVQRWLYRLSKPESSPEGLYRSYAKLYASDDAMTLESGRSSNDESTKATDGFTSKLPHFENLNDLQQFALEFPFESPLVMHPTETTIIDKIEEANESENMAHASRHAPTATARSKRASVSHIRKLKPSDQKKRASVVEEAAQMLVKETPALAADSSRREEKVITAACAPEAENRSREKVASQQGQRAKKLNRPRLSNVEDVAVQLQQSYTSPKKNQTHRNKKPQGASLKDDDEQLTEKKKHSLKTPRRSRDTAKRILNEGPHNEPPTRARRRGRPMKTLDIML